MVFKGHYTSHSTRTTYPYRPYWQRTSASNQIRGSFTTMGYPPFSATPTTTATTATATSRIGRNDIICIAPFCNTRCITSLSAKPGSFGDTITPCRCWTMPCQSFIARGYDTRIHPLARKESTTCHRPGIRILCLFAYLSPRDDAAHAINSLSGCYHVQWCPYSRSMLCTDTCFITMPIPFSMCSWQVRFYCIGKRDLQGWWMFRNNRPSMAPLATLSDTSPRRHRAINWNRFCK